ncbi:unnamed protein product [Victoria cruziana]
MWKFLALFTCFLLWNLASVRSSTDQPDVFALNTWYTVLGSPSQLTGWSLSGGDPCGQSWTGIICSGSAVTEIKLSGVGLSGSLGYSLDGLKSVIYLDLSNNNLTGQIPYQLPPNCQQINLAGNGFTGDFQYSISLMTNLTYINLGHNQLQNIGDFFGKLSKLTELDLSFNNFSGNLPPTFSSLSSLNTLYLQNNEFTGSLDALTYLPLLNLNVANNHFSGAIPPQLLNVKNFQYLHEICSPSIMHKNLNSFNILLDNELNPHLSDCGLANLVPSTNPQVLLRSFFNSRPRLEQSLVRWATPQLHDIDALSKMVDPALKELYPVKSLSRFADVIALCVQPETEFRPPMSEVVQSLVTLVQRANMSKRTVGCETISSHPLDGAES